MKATFKVTFLLQKGKIKANGKAPIVTRIIVNGEMAHFSTQQEIAPDRLAAEKCLCLIDELGELLLEL